MPKPSADLNISRADEVKMGSCSQDIVLQISVTPVSAEAFILLQNLIINQNAHMLDDTSKQKLEKHV